MIQSFCVRLFKKGQKAGHLVILGSLFSCAGGQLKRPTFQQAQNRSLLKMELMRLWAKAEYKRILGDELGAQAVERDLELIEKELDGSFEQPEEALSSRNL
jgi:hypothetical protein